MAQTQRSGANLVESLNLLARISRDRESVRKKITAMSAQGRLQGIVLCLVPILFMAGLFISSPQSLFPVIKSSLGKTILLLALILQTTGGVIIIKMVSKEII
jgi:tight adherence protein B